MTTTHLALWLDLLQTSCAEAGTTCLHIIFDQAHSAMPLLPSVISVEPPLPWRSLLSTLPDGMLEDVAPLLIKVDLALLPQRQWLLGVMQAASGHSQLLVLGSLWPFADLASHLGCCAQASNGGYAGLLRFYDPALFALLFSHVLDAEQQQRLLSPAFLWSWLDRDGVPQRLLGPNERFGCAVDFAPVQLTDCQVEALCCVSDATVASAEYPRASTLDGGLEQHFQRWYAAMLEATQAGLIVDDQRHAFCLERVGRV